MKPFKRIIFLFVFIAVILLFWLLPRINKASGTDYKPINKQMKKIYLPNKMLSDTIVISNKSKNINNAESKTNKRQNHSIENHEEKKEEMKSLNKLRPKMYGRGMIYFPEEDPLSDSTNVLNKDTVS